MEPLKEVKQIIIHHSGSRDSIESIKDLHINSNGWENIGYHWVIDKEGNLLKGRDEKFIGAHCLGKNKDSIAVCLIGDFLLFPTREKQMTSLIEFLKKKMKEYNLSEENIFGHKEIGEREEICPGDNFDLDWLRKQLKLNN